MIGKYVTLLRVALTPGVRRTPLAVFAELRRRGIRRGPAGVDRELSRGRVGLNSLRFALRCLDGEQITRHNGRFVVNTFLPPFPSSAYDRMFTAMLSGRRLSPVSAFFAITAKCPLSCGHCSAKLRPAAELDTEVWKKAIREAVGLGAAIIGFTGGEPLTRSDLTELIAYAGEQGAASILFTSGLGLTEARAAELRGAGLWALGVSLDHTDPGTFDRIRGREGTFKAVCDAVRLSVKTGFYTMTCCLSSPELVLSREYEKIHKLSGKLGAHELRIVEPMPCGLLRAAEEGQFLTPGEIAQIRDFHVGINRRGVKPKVCAFNRIESPELFGCGGGTLHLYIDSAGSVCPCDFTPMSFGNITVESLPEVWERMTGALGEPRRNCLIRQHAGEIARVMEKTGEYPLSPENSCALCREIGYDTLPDYFRAVTGRTSTLPAADETFCN